MRILVTGATGYVGRAVARALRAEQHTVHGLTRDTSAPRALELSRDGITVVPGDIGDPASYRHHLTGVDVVLHTVSDADRPAASDRDLFTELLGLQQSGRSPHLIYTTGCSVYGTHRHPVLTEDVPGDAAHPRFVLEEELRASGLSHTVVRPAFVFGGDGRSSLLGRWLEEARDGTAAFYGDPDKVWSWVHVDDLADGFVAVVRHIDDVSGEIFLFADDHPANALETYRACQERFGHDASPRLKPISEEDELYQVFDRDEVVDSRKARERLGWRPTRPGVLDALRATPDGAETAASA